MRRQPIKEIVIRVLIITAIFLFMSVRSSAIMTAKDDANAMYLFTYGGVPFLVEEADYGSVVLFTIMWSIPCLVILYVLCDFVYRDFETAAVYIFTRVNRRKSWFLSKASALFLYVAFFYAAGFLATLLVCAFSARDLSGISASLVANLFFLNTAGIFIFVLFENILSIKTGVIKSYFVTVLVFMSSALAAVQIGRVSKPPVKYLPASQMMLTWHDCASFAKKYPDFWPSYVPGFTLAFSYVYLMVLVVLLVVAGLIYIDRTDII